MKFYKFIFADGYSCVCCGMSKQELEVEQYKHGKLVAKVLEGVY